MVVHSRWLLLVSLIELAVATSDQTCTELVLTGLVTTGQSVRDAIMGSYRRTAVFHDGKPVFVHAQIHVKSDIF